MSVALETMQFLQGRYHKLAQQDRDKLRTDARNQLASALLFLRKARNLIHFKVTKLVQPKEFLTQFLSFLTTAELVYLFEDRTDITGLDVMADDQTKLTMLNNVFSIPSGATTISAIKVNQVQEPTPASIQILKLESEIDCASFNAQFKTIENLIISIECLGGAIETSNEIFLKTEDPPEIPYVGQPFFTSPATVSSRRLKISWTFPIDIDFLLNIIDDVGGLLVTPIKALVRIVDSICKIVDKLLDKFKSKVKAIVKKIESFVSRFNSLTGSGNFDASLIKCAINFDVSFSLPFLDDLANILDPVVDLIKWAVGGLRDIISAFINNLICKPFNLINSFLTQWENRLPTACSLFRIPLPKELEDALLALQRACPDANNTVMFSFNKDLLNIRAGVTSGDSRIKQFRKNALCQTESTNRFLNTSLFGFKKGFRNPLSSLSKPPLDPIEATSPLEAFL
jgi:hypothetical protein